MGNSSSSTTSLQDSNSSLTNNAANATMTGSALTTPKGSRRIVKAVKPAPSEEKKNSEDTYDSSHNNSNDDDDFDDKKSTKKHRDPPLIIAESPSVARELEFEKLEQQKQNRLQNFTDSQRMKREKRLEERRKNPQQKTNQPNPFSQFLSAFSVNPKHPEHKRAYEMSENDDPEPPGKIPRSESDVDIRDGVKGDDQGQSSFVTVGGLSSQALLSATVAVVVAIAAGIVWRVAHQAK